MVLSMLLLLMVFTRPATGVSDDDHGDGEQSVNVFPNPCAGRAVFEVNTQSAGRVEIRVYDVMHHEVAVVIDQEMPAGSRRVEFDASLLPEGMYWYILKYDKNRELGSIVVVR